MNKLKISILTATYNRANLLPRLFESISNNLTDNIEAEWLIMDDGSTDETKSVVETFISQNKLQIKFFSQENQGKMQAINNLMQYAQGDLIIECDSDDYFANNAFKVIEKAFEENASKMQNFYALCFLKYDQTGKNMGENFSKETSKMFDLYFKEGETGEKALVFNGKIRKQYKYELENGERFITEARMFHKMDEKYSIICINKPIMICEYQNDGYTRNIKKQFIENPFGYFNYFKEILQKDMKGVTFKKRLYAIKHYILFSYLTKSKNSCQNIKEIKNKFLYLILYFPGIVKSKIVIDKLFDNEIFYDIITKKKIQKETRNERKR